jgi:hypothetical protein
MKQRNITVSMGKRLIGKGMAQHPDIKRVLAKGTLVIIAGSTNGYVAEEILASLGQAEGFSRRGFRRGLKVPPDADAPEIEFPGDVVITDGQWVRGKTVTEVAKQLQEGDVVLKGANAFDPRGQAAVQIGSDVGGTILASMPAVIGRRVRLIVPVGLEKRVFEDVNLIAQRINAPGTDGPRLFPMPGPIFTELDAIRLLTGAQAHLLAAGGVYGAEGSLWLGIEGAGEQVRAAVELIESVAGEPPCEA